MMKGFAKIALSAVAVGFAFAAPVPARQTASPAVILPEVTGPLASSPTSHPFLDAAAKLASAGYVEEEFFLSGAANVYDWTGDGHAVKVVAGPGRYTTRILVRRPRDAARFSGNVEVTILNASLGADLGAGTDAVRMEQQGDVWIGITSKALSADALKKFDPVRYAALTWASPVADAKRCADPSIIPAYMMGGKEAMAQIAKMGVHISNPATEDGLIWDMLGQLGLLLKSDRRQKILPGFGAPRLYMTGVSQSALYIRTWLAGFHDRYHTRDGKPVYDGYLGVVGPALIRINQCSEDIPLADPRQKLTPPDVPFISISSEGETWQSAYTRQADFFTSKGGIVSYQVAGASHISGEVPGIAHDSLAAPSMQDMAKAGVKLPDFSGASMLPAGALPNDFIWAPAIRGAYHNLQLWVRQGTRPPLAAPIALDAQVQIRRDANGNALGGLRMPYIDVPTSAHQGFLTPGGFGGVMGLRKPFSSEKLKALYPDHAAYVVKFSAATDRLTGARFISTYDAVAMKKAAEAAPIPVPAAAGAK